MNEKPVKISLKNPDHIRQVTWQIWVPLGFSCFILVALAVWSSIATGINAATGTLWSSISLIFMIIPVMFAGLLLLAFLGLIVYGVAKLSLAFPGWMHSAQLFFRQVSATVHYYADRTAQPVFTVRGVLASITTFFTKIISFKI